MADWFFSALVSLFGLFGLALARGATDDGGILAGWLFFFFAVFYVFTVIHRRSGRNAAD